MIPDNPHIQGAFFKALGYLNPDKNIAVSVSGGSDSDIVIDFINQCGYKDNVHYFFIDTGLEYRATKEHLTVLENKYDISIDRVKAIQSIPHTCKKYGQPFLSKNISGMIENLQQHNFNFEDRPLSELLKDYPGCREPIRWWCNDNKLKMKNISYRPGLRDFLIENPPDFKISAKCCKYSKKQTAKRYYIENKTDIAILGLRSSEGGVRSIAFNSCYSENSIKPDQYRPIWWFNDQDKNEYANFYGVTHSDCYTKYGMCRTGCVGCPFALDLKDNLKAISKYEPYLYRSVNRVFSDAYKLTDKFNEFKTLKKYENKRIKIKTPALDAWGII